jgi:hypothetical protein
MTYSLDCTSPFLGRVPILGTMLLLDARNDLKKMRSEKFTDNEWTYEQKMALLL